MIDNTEIIEQTGALKHLTPEDLDMLKKSGRKLGSALCYVLRHNPDRIGVSMDKQAWVTVAELISKFNAHNTNQRFYLSLPVLMELVRTDSKQRYGLKGSNSNLMIRCRQGHSIPWLEMDYREMTPPDLLYHGTSSTFLASIMSKGLLPMSRQKVHLSKDVPTAISVAKRHLSKDACPMILEVDTAQMVKDGITFYLADNDVWLVDYIAQKYLTLMTFQ